MTVPQLIMKLSKFYEIKKVHHYVHNRPIQVTNLSQINPLNNLPLYFFKIHFDVTLPSVPRYPSGVFLGVPLPPKPCTLFSTTLYVPHATCPAHVIPLDLSLTPLIMQLSPVSWCLLYAFFWVIPWNLNFIC